jgi:hypothetical protein
MTLGALTVHIYPLDPMRPAIRPGRASVPPSLTPQIRICCQSTDLTAEAVQAGLLNRQLPAVASLPAR